MLFSETSEKGHSVFLWSLHLGSCCPSEQEIPLSSLRPFWETISFFQMFENKNIFLLTFKSFLLEIIKEAKEMEEKVNILNISNLSPKPKCNFSQPRVSIQLTFCFKSIKHIHGIRLEEGPCQIGFEFLANGSLYISFQRPNYVCINKLCYAA